MKINNKVVIVTGASSGIGRATAELFGKNGAKVALAARSADKLEELSASIADSFVVPVDITKPDEVRQMVQKTLDHYGRLDVLINNAGRGLRSPVEHIDLNDFAYIMSLNVFGPLVAMQSAIPIMRKQGSGTIVNISSQVARGTYPGLSAYAATKSALTMISLVARQELAEDGIAVSTIYPRGTATDFRKHTLQSKVESKFVQVAGVGELDSPEKVASKILEIVETGATEGILE
jgi:NADP-dependent 3-hydroxy acid dehydrogenase YdfG